MAVVRRDFPGESEPELRLVGCLGVSWTDGREQDTQAQSVTHICKGDQGEFPAHTGQEGSVTSCPGDLAQSWAEPSGRGAGRGAQRLE